MYRLSGCPGESGGTRALLSNRQQLQSKLSTSVSEFCIHCLCLTWPRSLCCLAPPLVSQRRAPGSGVRDNNCCLFSITNTFSVNCHHQPATWCLLGTWKVVKTILWFINKSWMFKTQKALQWQINELSKCNVIVNIRYNNESILVYLSLRGRILHSSSMTPTEKLLQYLTKDVYYKSSS